MARIFNTYGPRMHPNDGHVVSNFIVQALQGEDINVYGDGSQTRRFCYVDDLVEGLLRFITLAGTVGEPGFPGPINLGNPVEFTIRELAQKVVSSTVSKSRIVTKALQADDPMQRQPNIDRATRYLDGRQPEIQLDRGLRQTITYFDDLLTSD